jgi:DNA polymerase
VDTSVYVPPDGPRSAEWAIVGEAPAREEVAKGRGFVGASGKILWPLLDRLAGIHRTDCYVSNLCKHPFDDEGGVKLTPDEFTRCAEELQAELLAIKPDRTLAVGALVAEALLGSQWRGMRTCNGAAFATEFGLVVPCWHPAAALRGDSDTLSWTGAAIAAFRMAVVPRPMQSPRIVDAVLAHNVGRISGPAIGIDTEGTADAPHCLTWASQYERVYVQPKDVPRVWECLCAVPLHVYHNAPWDWKVIEAMGVKEPWKHPYADTMELAYVRHTEPQGLKDLAWRHMRIDTPSWSQLVEPYHAEVVRSMAEGIIAAGTTEITHSPKTGKLLKKPKVERTEQATLFHRRLGNTEWLAEQLGIQPDLTLVPRERAVEYATLDPFLCLMLWELWRTK